MLSGVLLTADETAEAKQVFCEVLRAAATTGLYQSILDEGPEIGTLLLGFQDSAQRTGVSNDLLPHAGKLIAGWRELYQPARTANPAPDIVEFIEPSREQYSRAYRPGPIE